MGRGSQRHRWRWTVAAIILPLILGVAVALAPFWIAVRSDLDPPGAACWFEHDPGSGRSGVGVERIEWGLAPHRVCSVVGSVGLPTSGPEFGAAVERSRQDAGEGEPPEEMRTFPVLGVFWPFVALAVTLAIWTVLLLVAWQISADRRTLEAVGRPKP